MKFYILSQRKILLSLLVITTLTCISSGIKLDLNATCSGTSTYYCTLNHLTSTFDEPLTFVTNSTAEELTELIIYDSKIGRIPVPVFEIASKLYTLMLYNCGVNSVLPGDFDKAKHLHKLMLQQNRLSFISERTFAALDDLEELYLPHNTIHMIHRYAFAGLKNLKYLDLQENGIRSMPEGVFDDLINLEHLDLSKNEIEVINENTFSKNMNLKTLLLGENKFSEFHPNSLMHLKHLNILDLSNTLLEELNLQSVDLLMVQNSGLQKCSISRSIVKLNAVNNNLKSLSIQDKLAVRELELRDNLFETLDDMVGMLNLQKLDISKNRLTTLKTSHSPMYLPLPNLISLNLASNILKNLTIEQFMFMAKLKYLDLAFNHFIRLEAEIFTPLVSLEKFYIEGNRLYEFDYVELKRSHENLHEVGIFENDWEVPYLDRMLKYLRAHNIRLPKRFTSSDSAYNQDSSEASIAKSSSLKWQPSSVNNDVDIIKDMSHARQSASAGGEKHLVETHQLPQSLIGVSGIHPYWTLRDILALLTLIVVLLILLLNLFFILQEEQCWPRCCRRYFGRGERETEPIRPRHQRLAEDNSVV